GEGVGGSEEVAGETVAYDPQAEAVTLQRIETFRQQLDEAREALRLAEAALDDEQRRERPDAARLAELAEQVEAARDEAAKRADSLSSEQGTLLEIRRSAPEVLESAETVRVAPTTLFTTERETIVRKLREARISLVPPNWGTTFSLVRQALTASAETFEAKQVVI